MKWRSARQSTNVQDRRGAGVRGGGIGIGGLVILIVIGLLMGKNPLEMLGMVAEVQQSQPSGPGAPQAPIDDEASQFVRSVLGETEDVWGEVFRQSGKQYPQPTLELFSGMTRSACGSASSAVGPFYCPADRQVYIDLSFFNDMARRLGGGGDFAQAYVIAHEVGHHVQHVTGSAERVNQARERGESVEGAEGLLVRQELQADCYAGVWGNIAQQRHAWLETGDLEEALNTASAIGDDRLQRQTQGNVVPDSFTHGTSEQRVRWFRTGFDSGDPNRCDTFAAARL